MIELLILWATVIAPFLASILITLTYLPQIVKTYKTKKVEDLSVWFWVLLIGFLICMLSNATFLLITAGATGYFITELINFALAAVVLGQILYYRRKKKEKKNDKA
jgi:uncharacterized protein with PQ loop repeat